MSCGWVPLRCGSGRMPLNPREQIIFCSRASLLSFPIFSLLCGVVSTSTVLWQHRGGGSLHSFFAPSRLCHTLLMFCRRGGGEIWGCAQNRIPCCGDKEGKLSDCVGWFFFTCGVGGDECAECTGDSADKYSGEREERRENSGPVSECCDQERE